MTQLCSLPCFTETSVARFSADASDLPLDGTLQFCQVLQITIHPSNEYLLTAPRSSGLLWAPVASSGHFGSRAAMARRRVIGPRTSHPWPPHSPDLTPIDFFLCGYLESKANMVICTTSELKRDIKWEIRGISRETFHALRKVLHQARKRAELCHSRKGGLFEHVL